MTWREHTCLHHGAVGGHTELDHSKSKVGNELQPSRAACRSLEPREEDSECQAGRWQLGGNCTVGQPWRREPEGQAIPAQ